MIPCYGIARRPVMGGKSPNSSFWTVQCSNEEKAAVDAAAKAAGMNRNAFVRRWIRSLMTGKQG